MSETSNAGALTSAGAYEAMRQAHAQAQAEAEAARASIDRLAWRARRLRDTLTAASLAGWQGTAAYARLERHVYRAGAAYLLACGAGASDALRELHDAAAHPSSEAAPLPAPTPAARYAWLHRRLVAAMKQGQARGALAEQRMRGRFLHAGARLDSRAPGEGEGVEGEASA